MTERRDLKRRVRERQERTGESYMTALRHVQAQAQAQQQQPPRRSPSAIPTVETIDLTELGASLGIKCRIAMYPEVADRVDAAALLRRLRDVLLATEGDHDLALMRGVVLRGERPQLVVAHTVFDEGRRLVARARAGLGGASASGRMLALVAPGRRGIETVFFLLSLVPHVANVVRDPVLLISTLAGVEADPLFGWTPMSGGMVEP